MKVFFSTKLRLFLREAGSGDVLEWDGRSQAGFLGGQPFGHEAERGAVVSLSFSAELNSQQKERLLTLRIPLQFSLLSRSRERHC